MRHAARTDSNHAEIIAGLRKVGAFVIDMRSMGDGIPDMAAWFRGVTYWIEAKADEAAKRRKSSTAQRQAEIRARAAEHGVTVHVVTSVDEALRAIGALAKPAGGDGW